MKGFALDERERFEIRDDAVARPFSSFLPGIAGPLGIPVWVFYVNRGQTIASLGVENGVRAHLDLLPDLPSWGTRRSRSTIMQFWFSCSLPET